MIDHCVLGTAGLTAQSPYRFKFFYFFLNIENMYTMNAFLVYIIAYRFQICIRMQIIDSFLDTVMSVSLTKTEIIGGSVDGTVRTFDIRIGRYETEVIL